MMRKAMAAVAAALALGSTAEASEHDHQGWRFQITPYVWAPSLSGDVRPLAHAPTFHVGMSFREIFRDLDGAFFLTGTARYDRFVLLGDLTWASLSQSRRATFHGFPLASAKVRVSQGSLTLAGGYTVVQEPGFALDLLAGARGWSVRARLDVDVLGFQDRFTNTDQWVDPIVAARARVDLARDWSVIVYGDIGGFGVGSDLTWQAYGTVNYRVSDQFFVSAGYRHMAFDYSSGGMRLDVAMSGPLVGVTWRF